MIRLFILIAISVTLSFSQITSFSNDDLNTINRSSNFFDNKLGSANLLNRDAATGSRSSSSIDSKSSIQSDLLGLQLQQKDLKSNTLNSLKTDVYLDNIVDSLNYLVGPGDIFSVNIWGFEKKSFFLEIDLEGNIFIPASGIIHINNTKLTDAKKLINARFSEIYKNISINTCLYKIKEFRISAYGEVVMPGSFIANGATRLIDVINNAGGITNNGNRRKIKISNLIVNDTVILDLIKAQNCFDLNNNPYVKLGDQIFIPPRKEIISIDGFVSYPGIYDFRENESLRNLITLSGGFTRGADSNRIIVVRYFDDFDSINRYTVSFNQMDTFLLKRDDRVSILSKNDYRANLSVNIKGEVNYPGNYPIQFRKTTISDLIDLAGGLTENANLINGRLIRPDVQYPGEKEYIRVQKMNNDFLSYTDKKYLFSKSIETVNTVSINFSDILKKENKKYVSEMILENKDTIIIPKKYQTIKVLGSVSKQGILRFEPDHNFRFYIEKAGGYSKRADVKSVKIIKNENEQLIDPDNTVIEPGDVIWVPEKLHHNKIRIVKEVVVFLGSLATVIISVIAINNEL